jgi:TonB family protein
VTESSNEPSNRGLRGRLAAIPWRYVLVAAAGVALGTAAACSTKSKGDDTAKAAFDTGAARPDSYPLMLNREMPFRYPPALYAEKVQGNVILRIFVDTAGGVVNDSTRVVESSKVALLDSAALKGSRELKFRPAMLHGAAMPVTILFPVYFRHPEAPPPPGDSLLQKMALPSADSAKAVAPKDSVKKDSAKTTTKSSSSKSTSSKKSSSSRKKSSTTRHRRSG